jgi:hypothetical protein
MEILLGSGRRQIFPGDNAEPALKQLKSMNGSLQTTMQLRLVLTEFL